MMTVPLRLSGADPLAPDYSYSLYSRFDAIVLIVKRLGSAIAPMSDTKRALVRPKKRSPRTLDRKNSERARYSGWKGYPDIASVQKRACRSLWEAPLDQAYSRMVA